MSKKKCKNCRYWKKIDKFQTDENRGQCTAIESDKGRDAPLSGSAVASGDAANYHESYMITDEDFYCALFEKK